MSEENIKFADLVTSTRGNLVENIHQGVAVAMVLRLQWIQKGE